MSGEGAHHLEDGSTFSLVEYINPAGSAETLDSFVGGCTHGVFYYTERPLPGKAAN
ncbi:MAG: hypothetical protein HOI95_15465 [Chromatiales bacterium]|nr:hypothetical protein [Chromatiales bacterium]